MAVSLNNLDLNLLRIFDAVMEERSVLRAGQRIGLSQSAISHALARLRDLLGDELFVRTSSGMQPTARALAMAPFVREVMVRVELAVGPARFDPATSRRRFTLAANDFLTAVIVPHLLRILRAEAPQVDLVTRPGTRIDLAEQIDLGRVDVAVGGFSSVPARMKSGVLFEYDDVLIAHARHPLRKKPVSMLDLANLPLMVVSLGGQEEGAVEGYISERGLARRSEMFDRVGLERAFAASDRLPRLALVLPHFLALPVLLAGSDYAAIVPRPLAAVFAAAGGVSMHELPYPTEPATAQLVWHERTEPDPACAWLRRTLSRAAEAASSSDIPAGPRRG